MYIQYSLLVALLAGRISHVHAAIEEFDPNTSPTGEGCVDPEGFRDCFKASSKNWIDCGSNYCNEQTTLTKEDCRSGCGTIRLSSNVACWIRSCWNQVYSCEYQLTAIETLQNSPGGVDVPFFPAPDDAGGACSCNLAYLFGNATSVSSDNLCLEAAKTADSSVLDDCQCCASSLALSNTITACPNSDLSFINIEGIISSAKTTDTSSKCEVLDTNPSLCTSDYQFPFTNNIVLNPFKLPVGKPGSEPVTNLPGNAATDAGGEVFTLSLDAFLKTITLAPWDSKAGAVTGTGKGAVATGTGTGSGGQGGQTKGTATGNAAPSSTTNGGGKINAHYFLVGGGSAVLILLDLW